MREIPLTEVYRGLFWDDYSLDYDLVCPECESSHVVGVDIEDHKYDYCFKLQCLVCGWDYLWIEENLDSSVVDMPYTPMECDACDSPELYNSVQEEWQCPFCT